jgi:hypothetical protein
MKHELHTARRPILLESYDCVDRTAEPFHGLAKCTLGALPQARRDGGVMGVEDDLHLLLDTADDFTCGERLSV